MLRPGSPALDRAARPRVALVILALVALASIAYAGHSVHGGEDFISGLWAPIRGLLAGRNAYDPANVAYLRRYAVAPVGPLYTPTALLLHAPLAALGKSAGADAMAVLDAVLIWIGVVLLVPPRSARGAGAAAIVGTLLVLSAPAQDGISLGQMASWAFVGLALTAMTIGSRHSPWVPAVGVVLVSLKPQSALPILLVLVILRAWPVVVRAVLVLAVTSLPGAFLFLRAGGGLHTLHANVAFFGHITQNNLADPLNNRVDLLGLSSHLHGPVLSGLGWSLCLFAILGLALAVGWRRGRQYEAAMRDPVMLSVIGLFLVISLYHQPYDLIMLFPGPLVALSEWVREERLRRDQAALIATGATVLGTVLVLRATGRAHLVAWGLSDRSVRTTYFSLPVILAMVGAGAALLTTERR